MVSWYLTSAGQRYAAENGIEPCPECECYECRCASFAAFWAHEAANPPACVTCGDDGFVICPVCDGEQYVGEECEELCDGCGGAGTTPCEYCPDEE